MKIAFDFDGTLEFENVQEIAKELIELDHDVHIVTTRWDEEHKHNYQMYSFLSQQEKDNIHKQLYEIAEKLHIPYHFINMEYKAKFLKDNDFEMLIDDNYDERKSLDKNIKFVDTYALEYIFSDEENKNEFLKNLEE